MRFPGVGASNTHEAIAALIAAQNQKAAQRAARGDARSKNIIAAAGLGLRAADVGGDIATKLEQIAEAGRHREQQATSAMLDRLSNEKIAGMKSAPTPSEELAKRRLDQAKGLIEPDEVTAAAADRRRKAEARGIPTPAGTPPPSGTNPYDRVLGLLDPFEAGALKGRLDQGTLAHGTPPGIIGDFQRFTSPVFGTPKTPLHELAESLNTLKTTEGPNAIPDQDYPGVAAELMRRRQLGGGGGIPTPEEVQTAIPDVAPNSMSLWRGIMGLSGVPLPLQSLQENIGRENLRQRLLDLQGGAGPPLPPEEMAKRQKLEEEARRAILRQHAIGATSMKRP